MQWRSVWFGVAAVGLAACSNEPEITEAQPEADTGAETAAAPATTPYKPVASNRELMESLVAHAAEEYWGSVRIVVDAEGITEYFPETDEDWEEVWAAAMSLAESGNLMMMPPRALPGEWMRIAADMVDVGVEAAEAAEARDPEAVLAAGEQVYNVCVECHILYVPGGAESL